MTGEIENLLKLQQLVLERDRKKKERDTLPADLADVDRAFREKVGAIEALRKTAAEAERNRRVSEANLSDCQEKQKKYQVQLMAVKNSREYGAVLNEIDVVKKELKELEDEVVSLMEKIESAETDLKAREEALPADTEEHEAALAGWRRTQKEIDRDIETMTAQIQDLEKGFPPKALSDFYRLFEKKGQAIVRVVAGSCSACHVRLRPALYQALRISSEVLTCDSCKRILYYQPEDAAATS